MSSSAERCGCDESRRLSSELRHERTVGEFSKDLARKMANEAMRFRAQLYRRRLEVLELRLRTRVIQSRYTVWSTIPDIRDAQEARRARLIARLHRIQELRREHQ